MRVADAVRVTSIVRRLKVGETFTDNDGDWEVVGAPEVVNGDAVSIRLRRYPDGKQNRKYMYDYNAQVKMLRK